MVCPWIIHLYAHVLSATECFPCAKHGAFWWQGGVSGALWPEAPARGRSLARRTLHHKCWFHPQTLASQSLRRNWKRRKWKEKKFPADNINEKALCRSSWKTSPLLLMISGSEREGGSAPTVRDHVWTSCVPWLEWWNWRSALWTLTGDLSGSCCFNYIKHKS